VIDQLTEISLTPFIKPITHLNVSCESHLRKKLSQENLHKLLVIVLRDTLAS